MGIELDRNKKHAALRLSYLQQWLLTRLIALTEPYNTLISVYGRGGAELW
jgi:hypothetical protein